MKRLILMLAIAVMAATGAQAQFGNLGSKLKNKVKDKVKEKVESTTDKAKDQVKDQAAGQVKNVVGDQVAEAAGLSESSGNDDGGGSSKFHGFNYKTFWKKTFEPTEAAIAAVPWASNTSSLDFQTKTMKDLFAAYDHLPEYYFPFHPYYEKLPTYFYITDGEYNALILSRWMDYMKAIFKLPYGQPFQENSYFHFKDQDYFVAMDLTFRNAYLAYFVIDPNGTLPFENFTRLLCFHPNYYGGFIEYNMEKPEEGMITKDWFIYKGTQQKYREWVQEGTELGEAIATEVTPIKLVQDHIQKCFDNFNDEASNIVSRMCYGVMGLATYDRILTNHKDYKEDDDANQKIKRLITVNKTKMSKMRDEARTASLDPIAEPTSCDVPASIAAQATSLAKKEVGPDKFEKVIYERSDWTEFKEHNWPYRVLSYVIPIGIVYKDGGKRYIKFYDLGKSPTGGIYKLQASSSKDIGPFPLK